MTSLIRTADAAYPFDYRLLPSDVGVIIGYAGGFTPHAWTLAEVMSAEAAGLVVWMNWTLPERPVDSSDGLTAANGQAGALTALGYPAEAPVFLDVEHSTWSMWPGGAKAAIATWKHTIMAARPRCSGAYAYVPWEAQFDWVANWTGVQPAALPAGCIGWQYDHALAGDSYDISIMDAALLDYRGGHPGKQHNAQEGADMFVTKIVADNHGNPLPAAQQTTCLWWPGGHDHAVTPTVYGVINRVADAGGINPLQHDRLAAHRAFTPAGPGGAAPDYHGTLSGTMAVNLTPQ